MKIKIHNQESRDAALNTIKDISTDKRWDLELKAEVKKRSLSQNSLMWMWLDKIAEIASQETGYEVWEIHELFKENFLQGKSIELGGVECVVKSTKNLTTVEMTEYLDSIDRFCKKEMAINLPLPIELQRYR